MSYRFIDSTTAPPRLHFRIPPRPSRLLRARDRIRDYLRQYCTERQVIDDVVLCVEEAATNAIRHSGSDQDIEISLRFTDDELLAEVKDRGGGFDLASFDREALPDILSDHGRGLYIVARLMDSLELAVNGGLHVRMTRRAAARCEPSPLESGLSEPRAALNAEQGGDRTRAMLDELEEGFIALDWEYRYVHANRATLHVSGKSLDDLLGRTPWEVFPELETAPLRDLYRQAMERGQPSVSEHQSIFDDTWREMRIYPTLTGVSAYFNDITERKRVEERLRESQALLQAVMDESPDPIFVKDKDSRLLLANAALLQVWGRPADEVIGHSDRELYDDPAIGDAIVANDQAVMTSGLGQVLEEIVQTQDGLRTYLSTKSPYRDDKGEIAGVLGIARDITERKQAESALRESEERFRSLFESMTEGVALHEVVYDGERAVDYRIVDVNRSFELQTGLAAESARGRLASELYGTGDAPYLEEYARVAEGGEPFAFETLFKPMGRHFRITAVSPAQGRFATVFEDVTGSKQTEEALRDAEAKSRDLIRFAPTGIYEIDFRGPRFKSVNDAMCAMSGYERDELLAMDPSDLLDAESQAVFAERIRRGLAGESVADSVEYRCKTKDGRLRDVILNTTLTENEGVIDGAFVVGHDITERKLAESEFRERDARLRALFENLQDGFYLAEIVRDGDGKPSDYRYLEVNRAFEELMGSDRARLIGRLATEAVQELDHAWVTVLGEVADSGTPVRYCRYSKVFERYFEIAAFRPAAGQVGVIVSDVTQQREAQARADHEHQTLTAVLEGSPAAALYLDREFTIRVVNRQLERNTGMTREQLIGRNYFEALPQAGLRRFVERARDAGRAVELTAVPMGLPARPDRGVTYWDWKAQPVTDAAGQVEGLVLSSVDVTRVVRSQRLSDALSRISLHLADAADPTTALEGAGRLAVDALGCDAFLAARLDADQWTPLQGTHATPLILTREPGRWPESSAGDLDVSPVADWQADARVSPAWKQKWRLHACLFAPLVSNGRLTGGLFFGVRERPRAFDAAEREFARRCAAIITVVLDNMRLAGDLERSALTLQESLLRPLPLVRGLQLASVSQPAHEADLVGGDFHDAFLADDDHVVLLVGDVTGKGLGAAGLTETVRTAVRAFAAIDHAPDYVMRKASELLLRHEAARNQFVTAFMVTIDLRSGSLRYTSAGHPPAVHVSGSRVGYLPTQFAPPLGVWTDAFPVGAGRLALGDMLVLYTDGVTESRNARGLFGERRVLRSVRRCAPGGVQDVAEGLRDAAVRFGGTLRDDLEILAVRFIGRAADTGAGVGVGPGEGHDRHDLLPHDLR